MHEQQGVPRPWCVPALPSRRSTPRLLHSHVSQMLTFLVLSHVCTRFVCPAKQPTQQTTCNLAIKEWEKKNEAVAEEAEVVKLYCQVPPIQKMDNSLNTLKNCTHLSLSTNSIDRLIPLAGMKRLRILSMGRNQLKKIEKLDDVADTLGELWISYNAISTLDGSPKWNFSSPFGFGATPLVDDDFV